MFVAGGVCPGKVYKWTFCFVIILDCKQVEVISQREENRDVNRFYRRRSYRKLPRPEQNQDARSCTGFAGSCNNVLCFVCIDAVTHLYMYKCGEYIYIYINQSKTDLVCLN